MSSYCVSSETGPWIIPPSGFTVQAAPSGIIDRCRGNQAAHPHRQSKSPAESGVAYHTCHPGNRCLVCSLQVLQGWVVSCTTYAQAQRRYWYLRKKKINIILKVFFLKFLSVSLFMLYPICKGVYNMLFLSEIIMMGAWTLFHCEGSSWLTRERNPPLSDLVLSHVGV